MVIEGISLKQGKKSRILKKYWEQEERRKDIDVEASKVGNESNDCIAFQFTIILYSIWLRRPEFLHISDSLCSVFLISVKPASVNRKTWITLLLFPCCLSPLHFHVIFYLIRHALSTPGKIKDTVHFNERAVDAIFDWNCDPNKRSENLKRYNVL